MNSKIPNLTAIISPTRLCNRNCKYCYIEGKCEESKASSIMSSAVLGTAMEQINAMIEKPKLLWHGGD